MLLRFSVSNWMSFRDETTLDMVATREKQHPNHLTKISPPSVNLLPVAAIYGGNASGKSNLVKALHFVEQFVTDPPKPDAPIPVRPFRLERNADSLPTSFTISFLAEDSVYEYSFSLNTRKVLREELKRIDTREETIFRRQSESEEFFLDPKTQNHDQQMFAFRGTHDNQLFLSNSVSQKLKEFTPVYDWFDSLRLVFPESTFSNLFGITGEEHPLHDKFVATMSRLDSGIASLRQTNFLPESALPKELVEMLLAELEEGQTSDVMTGTSLRKVNGTIVGQRLTPVHRNENGEDIPFSLNEESDGTRRLFDILPAFLLLDESEPYVFIIDELDRSLHPLLTMRLLQSYLEINRKGPSRVQLIFTTHDVNLLTQDLFRRDEIWITERDSAGASKLLAFSEFKDVRKDKDIRKSYLQGRMGGVPRIRTTSSPCRNEAPMR